MKKRVKEMMRRAKRSFLWFSDPMDKVHREITRSCVICGEEIFIKYNRITKSYVGGHYFFGKGTNMEYWECEVCFNGN